MAEVAGATPAKALQVQEVAALVETIATEPETEDPIIQPIRTDFGNSGTTPCKQVSLYPTVEWVLVRAKEEVIRQGEAAHLECLASQGAIHISMAAQQVLDTADLCKADTLAPIGKQEEVTTTDTKDTSVDLNGSQNPAQDDKEPTGDV